MLHIFAMRYFPWSNLATYIGANIATLVMKSKVPVIGHSELARNWDYLCLCWDLTCTCNRWMNNTSCNIDYSATWSDFEIVGNLLKIRSYKSGRTVALIGGVVPNGSIHSN